MGLENPDSLICRTVCNESPMPHDLNVPVAFFDNGRARECLDVEMRPLVDSARRHRSGLASGDPGVVVVSLRFADGGEGTGFHF